MLSIRFILALPALIFLLAETISMPAHASPCAGCLVYENTSSGTVGIGTTIPGHLFSVQGVDSQGAINLLSGSTSAGNYTAYGLGRKSTDGVWAVSSQANDFVPGTSAGDIILETASTTNLILATNATSRLYVASGGNVGIATTSASYTLTVNGSVAGTSNYVNTSDARLKKDVTPIAYGLDTVMRLRPVGFNWIDQSQEWKKQHQLGLIAQEVEPIVPEVVTIADDKMKTRSLAYGELVPVLIKAVQELKADNDNLHKRIEKLEAAQSK